MYANALFVLNSSNNFDEDPLKNYALWEYDTLCSLGYGLESEEFNNFDYIPKIIKNRK